MNREPRTAASPALTISLVREHLNRALAQVGDALTVIESEPRTAANVASRVSSVNEVVGILYRITQIHKTLCIFERTPAAPPASLIALHQQLQAVIGLFSITSQPAPTDPVWPELPDPPSPDSPTSPSAPSGPSAPTASFRSAAPLPPLDPSGPTPADSTAAFPSESSAAFHSSIKTPSNPARPTSSSRPAAPAPIDANTPLPSFSRIRAIRALPRAGNPFALPQLLTLSFTFISGFLAETSQRLAHFLSFCGNRPTLAPLVPRYLDPSLYPRLLPAPP